MVALSQSATLVLREHRENQTAQRLDGSPMLPDTVSQAWRRPVRRMRFHGLRLHDARHTHASLLLKQGVHPNIVQERLSHSTIATTFGHVLPRGSRPPGGSRQAVRHPSRRNRNCGPD